MFNRRDIAALVGASLLFTSPAWSQTDWPTRPIKIVVPVAVGGRHRLHGPCTCRQTRRCPRPARDRGEPPRRIRQPRGPDGYTLVMPITSFPINPSLQKLPFDTVKDCAPIVLGGTLPLALVANPSLPATNVKELIALGADRRPLSYANSGTGATAHLAGELFKRMAGIQMTSVNYKGGGPAVSDLLGGTCSCTLHHPSRVPAHPGRQVARARCHRQDPQPRTPQRADGGRIRVAWVRSNGVVRRVCPCAHAEARDRSPQRRVREDPCHARRAPEAGRPRGFAWRGNPGVASGLPRERY